MLTAGRSFMLLPGFSAFPQGEGSPWGLPRTGMESSSKAGPGASFRQAAPHLLKSETPGGDEGREENQAEKPDIVP